MRQGISLIELLAVAMVLGVLAILGIPTYRATMERAYCREAHELLLTIYTGERLYYSRNSTYLARGTGDDWRPLNLDNPNTATSPLRFTVDTSCGVDCFVASAIHSLTSDIWLTVDHNRLFASPSGRCET